MLCLRLLLQVVFEAAAPVGDQPPLEKQQQFPHLVSVRPEHSFIIMLLIKP